MSISFCQFSFYITETIKNDYFSKLHHLISLAKLHTKVLVIQHVDMEPSNSKKRDVNMYVGQNILQSDRMYKHVDGFLQQIYEDEREHLWLKQQVIEALGSREQQSMHAALTLPPIRCAMNGGSKYGFDQSNSAHLSRPGYESATKQLYTRLDRLCAGEMAVLF